MRPHGWLAVHVPGGVIEVPLVGELEQDERLARVASAGGRFVVERHPGPVVQHGDAWEGDALPAERIG